ncbi:hypothetical protein [Pseudoduganella sp. RAF53_2]|uniref:hypothetical protein n=1 Tax=unclassified Pseudoduganella TaxID=2637179 RepID=UPI003F9A7DBA
MGVELDAIEAVFDALTEVAFFIKDCDGRYVAVNHTLAPRLVPDPQDAAAQ